MGKVIKILTASFKKAGKDYAKTSYAQDGEDILLNSFFDDLEGRNKGFYIDVGALHPFRFSNTMHFYEKGWNGINIEPTPNAIESFNKHRKNDINLNLGISDQQGVSVFYCFNEPALNSFSKEVSEEIHNNTKYKIKEQLNIPVYPLSDILDKYLPQDQYIDFMSIDTEGLDLQVLKSNNWLKYKPEFILVEDFITFEKLDQSEIYGYLKNLDYELVAKTIRTMIFKLKDEK